MDWRNALLLGGLVFASTAPCQDPQAPKAPPAATAKKTVGQWIDELGNDSYRVRLEAERALREMGDAALPELRKAADDAGDNETQIRARRLVRQIERGGTGRLSPRATPGQPVDPQAPQGQGGALPWLDQSGLPDDVRSHFEDLFRHFEDDFGLDVPRGSFFRDDFFKDLQQQFDAKSSSNGMQMEVRPDGSVHVEVQSKNEKGETEKKVYDAPDMKTFQEQYPDVLGQGGNLRMFFGGPGQFGQMPRFPGIRMLDPQQPGQMRRLQPFDDAAIPAQAPVDEHKRLGVMIRPEIGEELREHLDLPAGKGLMVESVVAGSLAEKLGLQARDIVLQIAGKDIGSTQDVQDALGAIANDQEVAVEFLRRGHTQTAKAVRPVPVETKAPAVQAEPGDAAKKLERRLRRAPGGNTVR